MTEREIHLRCTLPLGIVKVLVEIALVLEGSLAQDTNQVVAHEHLLLEQLLGHSLQLDLFLQQQILALLVRLVDNSADFLVDVSRGLL